MTPALLPDPVQFAIPAFIGLILIEMVIAKRRDPLRYEGKDTLTSLLFGVGSSIVNAAIAGWVYAICIVFWNARLWTLPFAWWTWVLAFVLVDFRLLLVPPRRAPLPLVLGQPCEPP